MGGILKTSLGDGWHEGVQRNGKKCVCCAQLYGCNVLNLGDSKVLSVHAATARQIVRSPHFHGDVQVGYLNMP